MKKRARKDAEPQQELGFGETKPSEDSGDEKFSRSFWSKEE